MNPQKTMTENTTEDPAVIQHFSKKRLWAFRLIALIGIPLVLFVCVEAGLRLGRIGYPTDIATKQTVNGTDRYCYNTKLGWRFFPKKIARGLSGFAFDIEKSPQTYRIFVLGASAARGTPDETYNFGRFLEIMLENEYPKTDFEVINVAMTAINSHAVYQIAKSCAKFEPDLMIVYLGNNEVVGPYGAGTVFAPLSPSLPMIRANAAMTCMKTGQLLQGLLSAVGSGGKVPQSWGGMEMFLDEQVRPESDALKIVYGHFEQNLRDICNVGIQAGANVLLSNVACNLKDSPPFASLNRDGLTDSEKKAWKEHYRQGIAHETAGNLEAAVASYLAAGQIDDTFADLQFRLGRSYWRLGQYPKAKDRYTQAREYDTLRFRADATINKIIQSVAEGREGEGVYFVDAVKAMEANSPHDIPGNELFYEHVHYRFEGNYILAKKVFDQTKEILPEEIRKHKNNLPTLTLADCQDRLMFTVYERYQTAQFVLNKLINKPPFTNQSYHNDLVAELEHEAERFKEDIPSSRERIQSMYNEQIRQHPDDWRLRFKLAYLYSQDPQKIELATLEAKEILQCVPYDRAYDGLVPLLIQQNKLDEAEHYARERVKMRPFSPAAYIDLGEISFKKKEYSNAIKYCSRGIELQANESINAYGLLAAAFEKSGDPEEAIQTLYQAIENFPKEQTATIHIQLGLLLGKHNRSKEAVHILGTAISDFPPDQIKQEHDVFALLLKIDQTRLALELYRRKLTVQPDSVVILNSLAWIQAASSVEGIRNPKQGLIYAQKACELTKHQQAELLDTLAVAYAANGDFEKATKASQKALTLAAQDRDNGLAQQIQNRLRLFQSGKMFYDEGLN